MSLKTLDLPIFLASPVWACGHWGGQVYPAGTPRSGWLSWCSDTFNTVELTGRFMGQWAAIIAGWVQRGVQPFFFVHAPEDQFTPTLAARIQSEMPQSNLTISLHRLRHDSFPY